MLIVFDIIFILRKNLFFMHDSLYVNITHIFTFVKRNFSSRSESEKYLENLKVMLPELLGNY